MFICTNRPISSIIYAYNSKHTLDAKIPIIAAEKGSVEAGALATVGIDYYQLGYETGKMAVSVLKGEDISKMSIKMTSKTEIYNKQK